VNVYGMIQIIIYIYQLLYILIELLQYLQQYPQMNVRFCVVTNEAVHLWPAPPARANFDMHA
jgi:hypothetical protein